MERNALEFKNVTKKFGPVIANDHVNLSLKKGEILSVLGENGSGKTTLMNMAAGIYFPDVGEIKIDGKTTIIHSPQDAFAHRIGMVHQHFKLIDSFTALDNVLLGLTAEDFAMLKQTAEEKLEQKQQLISEDESNYNKEKLKQYKRYARRAGFNKKGAEERIVNLANKYGFHIDPHKYVYDMSVSEKQTLEILKILYRGMDILILDEPTAVLTPQEIRRLFDVLKNMRDNGKSIIIITHKLNEVMEISDRVAVLRKGKHIATILTKDTTEQQLAELMVGKKVDLDIKRTKPKNPVDRLFIKNVTVCDIHGHKILKNINLTARSGEVLGIAGIAGSGQKELLEAISGLHYIAEGDIVFHNPKKDKPVTFFHKTLRTVKTLAKEGKFHYPDGKPVNFSRMSGFKIKQMVNKGEILFNDDEIVCLKDKNPLQIRELGIRLSFVPEDRLGMGLVGSMNLVDNTMLRSYRHGHGFFLDRKKPREQAEKIIKDLNVSTPGVDIAVSKLSGGNVQKMLVGREIALAPKVLMTAYPVRGLDINSSYTIYDLLDKQKQNGIAVIFVGEDLDVLLAVSDRIAVLCNGQITGIVDARKTTKDEIGLLMTKSEVNTNGR